MGIFQSLYKNPLLASFACVCAFKSQMKRFILVINKWMGFVFLQPFFIVSEKQYLCTPGDSFLQELLYDSLGPPSNPKLEFNKPIWFGGHDFQCPPFNFSEYTTHNIREYISILTKKPDKVLCNRCSGTSYLRTCLPRILPIYDYENKANLQIEVTTDPDEKYRSSDRWWKKLYMNDLRAEFVVGMDMNANKPMHGIDFWVATKKSTAWTQIQLDPNSVINLDCHGGTKRSEENNCGNALFDLPDELFSGPLIIENKHIKLKDYPLAKTDKDFLISINQNTKISDRPGIISQVQSPQGGRKHAIEMKGCSLPILKFKVEYVASTQEKQGSVFFADEYREYLPDVRRRMLLQFKGQRTLMQNQNNVMKCWRRIITLTGILDSAPPNHFNKTMLDHRLECSHPIDIDRIKYWNDRQQNIAVKLRDNLFARSLVNASISLFYSESYLAQIIKCASNSKGMYWNGWSASSSANQISYPGFCASCPSLSVSIAKKGAVSTYCDPSNPLEVNEDCCYGCREGFYPFIDPAFPKIPRCVRPCLPGYFMANGASGGGCIRCEIGKHSFGGNASECRSCSELGYTNSKYVPGQGCVWCGNLARVSLTDARKCEACPPNRYVLGLLRECLPCPQGKYFPANNGATQQNNDTQCESCPAGKRGLSDGTCELCNLNHFTSQNNSLLCTPCATGTYSDLKRSTCLQCPALNSSLAEYYRPGCNYVRCRPAVAYTIGNPFFENGCQSCDSANDSRVIPPGSYRSSMDCSRLELCSNKPSLNAEYSGPAPLNSQLCPWKCSVGFIQSLPGDNTCNPCSGISGYDSTKHVFIDDRCTFHCKPGKFRNSSKQCDINCEDLFVEVAIHKILERVRFYNSTTARPRYVQGQYGMDDVRIQNNPLPFLQKGRFASILPDPMTETQRIQEDCGNALLNVQEDCDDGNKNNGDGCSSACKFEYTQPDTFWDCDEIGRQCKPDCGWPRNEDMIDTWDLSMKGFVFPRCVGTNCSCNASISQLWKHGVSAFYYDVVRLPVGHRQQWMQDNLISCDCYNNPFRMLPFLQNCTPENKGCRTCPSGEYFHDFRRECIRCGTHCLPGFHNSGLGCTVPFLSDDEETRQQADIGCIPCSTSGKGSSNLVWLPNNATHSCLFQCYRDSTGTNTSQDTYCITAPDISTGHCPSSCASCDTKRTGLRSPTPGEYIQGCIDKDGYRFVMCDSSILPAHAVFDTMLAPVVGDKEACAWMCMLNFFKLDDKLCAPIFTWTVGSPFQCLDGEYHFKIDSSNKYVCKMCEEGSTPTPYQTWRAKGPFFDRCIPECVPGVAWSGGQDNDPNISWACNPCSQIQCSLGQRKNPCQPFSDAYCEACSTSSTAMIPNSEYVEPGVCEEKSRCISGYYMAFVGGQKTCIDCKTVTLNHDCGAGRKWSSHCILPEERVAAPICVDCEYPSSFSSSFSYLNNSNQVWKPALLIETNNNECQLQCKHGYVPFSQDDSEPSCIPCGNGALCGYGYYGACVDSSERDYFTGALVWKTTLTCILCYNLNSLDLLNQTSQYYTPDLMYIRNGTCDVMCTDPSREYLNGKCVSRENQNNNGISTSLSDEEKEKYERELNLAIYLYHNAYPEREG